MRALLINRLPAVSASIAGEWALYVCVLLAAYENAELTGAFAYFAACALAWLPVSRGAERTVSGAALVVATVAGLVAVLTGAGSFWPYMAAGAAYGVSAKLRGMVPAPCAGVFGPPTWAGVAGGSVAVVSILIWDTTAVATVSATVAVLGAILSPDSKVAGHSTVQPDVPPVISYAALGLCFAAGLRAAEPGMGVDPKSALFFIPAWALGAQLVSTMVSAADPRAVLSAPFVAAMGLAAMGPVEGPGLLFLYMGIAASVALVTGWLGRVRWPMAVALIAGAVWACFGGADFDMTVWTAGAAALVGGFATLILAYRVPEQAAIAAEPVAEEVPAVPLALAEVAGAPQSFEVQSVELQAALILRDALAAAREIRQEALDRFRMGDPSIGQSVEDAKDRARKAAEELESNLDALVARVAR